MTFRSAAPGRSDLTLKNRVPGSCCRKTFATVSGLVVMLLPSKASIGPGMRIVVGTAPIGDLVGLGILENGLAHEPERRRDCRVRRRIGLGAETDGKRKHHRDSL